ncbi:MAG: peptidyl-prolyl cis-trans isomerase [Verrucomicrobiae bacterium]|nr:peptidyl-prolyl cis-trans isomerase [Verrucomicrobiae bacterium]
MKEASAKPKAAAGPILGALIAAALVFAVIIAFVFWGPQVGRGGRLRGQSPGKIQGQPVSLQEFEQARRAVLFLHYLRSGEIADARQASRQLDRLAWLRLVELRQVRRMGLRVPEERVAEFIRELPLFQERGRFSPERYRQFVQATLPLLRMNEAEFHATIAEQRATDMMRDIVASTAKVTPLEARQVYDQAHQMITVSVVYFSATNYLGRVQLAVGDIEDEFNKNAAAYRIPPRVKVRYIKIAADAFLSTVRVTEEEIAERYERDKAAFTDPKTQVVKPIDAVRDDLRRQIAMARAVRQARELAEKINDEVLSAPPPDLSAAARRHGLAAAETDFFSERDELKAITAPDFQAAALSLSAENPYEMVPAPDGAYLLQFLASKPSELPPLSAARPQVVENLTRRKAVELARQDGREKHDAWKTALASAATQQSLEQLAASAGLKAATPPAFEPAEPPRDLRHVRHILTAALSLAPGELSDLMETPDGALLAQLKQRKPADPARFAAQERELRDGLHYGARFRNATRRGQRDIAVATWLELQSRLANIEPAKGW